MTTVFYIKNMFVEHIQDSKLQKPEDFDNYNPERFPHFHVFMCSHLGRPIDTACLKENANIIAKIPKAKIKHVTFEELTNMGVIWGIGNLVWNPLELLKQRNIKGRN